MKLLGVSHYKVAPLLQTTFNRTLDNYAIMYAVSDDTCLVASMSNLSMFLTKGTHLCYSIPAIRYDGLQFNISNLFCMITNLTHNSIVVV